MLLDNKKQAAVRILLGAVVGVAAYLLLCFLTQPGWLFGGSMDFKFTFCYNSQVPEALGAALGILLWGIFGALAGVATLPFADGGRALLFRSLVHFGVMALTLWVWVILNFPREPLLDLTFTFLFPFALVYLLIWMGRWVGWYAEAEQIREKLGLTSGPSFLRWRETLPYLLFAALLCVVLPTVLSLCDAPDVPLLSALLYTYILLPVGTLASGFDLGRRQGFCPLYPLACGGFILLFSVLADLWCNMAFESLVPAALLLPLAGNLVGTGLWARDRK